MEFEKITDAIRECPVSYLPALLKECVQTCIIKRVFVSGGILSFVARIIKESGERKEKA